MKSLDPINVPAGIARGASPLDLPSRWWRANLVRWVDGRLRAVGGWQRITSSPFGSPVRALHVWRDNADVPHIAAFTDGEMFINPGGGFIDYAPGDLVSFSSITSQGFGYSAGDYNEEDYGTERSVPYNGPVLARAPIWTIDTFGEDLLAVSSADGRLLRWSPSESPPVDFTAVPTAPIGNRAVVVTPERHVMLIGYGSNPRDIAWSDREDAEEWNFADTTKLAGFLPIDTVSALVTGRRVVEGTLVWSDSEVFLVSFLGSPYIYKAERKGYTTLYGPNTLTAVDGRCAWLSRTGFQIWNGGMAGLPSPVSQDILNDIDPTYGPYRAFMQANGVFPEAWLFYPSVGNTECNRYVAVNVNDYTWTEGELTRSAMFPGGPKPYPYMAGVDGHIYEHENGWLDGTLSRVGSVWAETSVIGLDQTARDALITRVLLANQQGVGSTTLTIYSRQANEGAERTFGPYVSQSNGYVSTRAKGRDVRFRLSANVDGPWTAGLTRAEVTQAGRR